MAGDPAFTALLLAMGLRSFSMHPRQIAAVKQAVLRADTHKLRTALPQVLAADEPQAAAEAVFVAHRA
jgi:phosphoenolpyruvate-protein phosphotransferase (PTS system enzyme I)